MGKKYQQTQIAKEELKSDILDLMLRNPNVIFTKEELCSLFNMNERAVRAELERIANYYPVRATAGHKGYSLIWWDENSTLEELNFARIECAMQCNEIQNRIDSLNARLKPLIANLKVINEKINNKMEE